MDDTTLILLVTNVLSVLLFISSEIIGLSRYGATGVFQFVFIEQSYNVGLRENIIIN